MFDTNLDSNDREGIQGQVTPWSSQLKNQWFESDFSVMTNSQTQGSAGSSNQALSGGEGSAMFTNGDRNGAVYSSGVSTAGNGDGHSDPKVQWGFIGKDGSLQDYGGEINVGTYCNRNLNSNDCRPKAQMNLIFIR